jgi:limonene-1,2-epoxide hydrolase
MLAKPIAKTSGALFVAVAASSAALATTLEPDKLYQFVSSTACYVKQGFGAQTAAAAANNLFAPAGVPFFIHGGNGTHVSVIRHAADGVATLHEIQEI